ncbi:hypothetical protein CUTER_03205 [Corynebacterium uterequi]|uniref:Uncharacterized protein n=1 Tax=Corynebacterium uterequi TaxID=1072256 RepID=A0A0G3HD93_9CORY|nr:hypothetical protein [Corynebacterium uterequi]AKK10650.1 hypothetical protein CUTER_03205 [Corynebacterium uterequi]
METTSAALTLWFVTVDAPGEVLSQEPKADRGFGRKYLSQLNPAWPITPIGQFPLNRSVPPAAGEFYIAGYPGVTVVETWREDITFLSDFNRQLLDSLPARDVYLIAMNEDTGFGGFAHFSGGELRRAFSGTRTHVVEDHGLPNAFEAPYWAGELHEQLGGIALPFEPVDLARAAEREWLGVDIAPSGPDLQVVGYAVDGRPEPKIMAPQRANPLARLMAPRNQDNDSYDDYSREGDAAGRGHDATGLPAPAQQAARTAKRLGLAAASRAKQLARNFLR